MNNFNLTENSIGKNAMLFSDKSVWVCSIVSQQLESCVFRCDGFGCCTFFYFMSHLWGIMQNKKSSITVGTLKQIDAFKNTTAFFASKKFDDLTFEEKLLSKYLSSIMCIVRTTYKNYNVDLDDIISQCYLIFFEYLRDNPNALDYDEPISRQVCEEIHCRIKKYCKNETKEAVYPPEEEKLSVAEYCERKAEREGLFYAIENILPPKFREVITMLFGIYGEAVPGFELAEMCQVSTTTVYERKVRGIRLLRHPMCSSRFYFR